MIVEVESRTEHPHRCTAGHRWQHTGSAAVVCEIPAYDMVTGDLPFVAAKDCPVCCGRQDLLVRELHVHYCNLCDGDWDHEGVCVDGLAAYCPWCFPKPDSEPTPGVRRGPHFHYCPECGHSWQHETGCSAPLRAALPECTGCKRTPAQSDEERWSELAPAMPSRRARTLRERLRPLALPMGLAAGLLLSLPIVFTGYSALRNPAVNDSVSVTGPRLESKRPAPAPTTPTPTALTPTAPTPIAPAPIASAPIEPTPAAARRRIPTPRSEARRVPAIDHPSEQRAPNVRLQDAPSQPGPLRPASTSGTGDDSRAIPSAPAPSPVRSELIVESTAPAPEISPAAASESGVRATPVLVTRPSIPGAPPFSGLTGSSGRDPALDGHPRRVKR